MNGWRVALIYNLKYDVPVEADAPSDALAEYDSIETVQAIEDALPGLNPTVSDLCIMARMEGMHYTDLINEILYLAADCSAQESEEKGRAYIFQDSALLSRATMPLREMV